MNTTRSNPTEDAILNSLVQQVESWILTHIDNNCSTRFAPPKTGHTAGTTKQVETNEASFASRSLLSDLQEATKNAHRIFGG